MSKSGTFSRSTTFELSTDSAGLAPFRQKFRPLVEKAGFDSKTTYDILLSVDEALTNVIRHGYKGKRGEETKNKIRVSFSDFADRVEIRIEDNGPSFDPRQVPSPELPPERPGGLGLHLIRSLTDEVRYEPLRPQGNLLLLVKYKKGKGRNHKR